MSFAVKIYFSLHSGLFLGVRLGWALFFRFGWKIFPHHHQHPRKRAETTRAAGLRFMVKLVDFRSQSWHFWWQRGEARKRRLLLRPLTSWAMELGKEPEADDRRPFFSTEVVIGKRVSWDLRTAGWLIWVWEGADKRLAVDRLKFSRDSCVFQMFKQNHTPVRYRTNINST